MKFKKFHKNVMSVVTMILILVVVVIAVSEIIYIRKKSDKKIGTCDVAVLTYDEIDKDYFGKVRSGVISAAKEEGLTYRVFSVDEYGDSYEDTLKKVLEGKPSLVVMPDATFAETLYNYQNQYKHIQFVIVGAVPHNADNTDSELGQNVVSVTFDDAECGFVAGYTAVQNGYDRIAFACEDDNSRSVHYYYGYLQGADYAAGLNPSRKISVSVYHNLQSSDTVSIKDIRSDIEMIATDSDEIVQSLNKDESMSKIPVIYLGDSSLKYQNVAGTINNDIELSVKNAVLSVTKEDVDTGNTITNDATNNSIVLKKKEGALKKVDPQMVRVLAVKMGNKEITVIGDTSISIEELDLNHIFYTDNKVIK